jgi:hypothetical protein
MSLNRNFVPDLDTNPEIEFVTNPSSCSVNPSRLFVYSRKKVKQVQQPENAKKQGQTLEDEINQPSRRLSKL